MSTKTKIILASGSAARKSMLLNAGLKFDVLPADIDEYTEIETLTSEKNKTAYITQWLANEKARHIACKYPDALVIGSDQTLEFEGKILSKSSTIEDGKETLRRLAGKTHRLFSSVSVAQGDNTVFVNTDYADLTMHDFDDDFLEAYAARDPDALTSCVGGYKIEGAGAWLSKNIKGDNFTIMGMPLLPLLAFLRTNCKILP
jgi:septum formation protein